MRYCLLSVFGLEGTCGIDWHFDSLAYHQLSLFHWTMQTLSVRMRHMSRSSSLVS
ncbi:hypothetical protein HanRHA438_Chr10g0467781 [Helianthus annuus]|nr:hypothetical protein HanRHA438_Chr10g0467781 [Helianthus annuus]KAJ0884904.1 hypothetical protein HanPSC8_Chr10g0439231 [Helianthus annuus]